MSGSDHDDWLKREAVFERFEKAWQQEGPPRLDDYLPPTGDPDRLRLLRELIRIDQEYRASHGQPATDADYLALFPELAEATLPAANGRGQPVGRCLGHYELKDAVGQGSFATVFRAWDAKLRREVAVKVPRLELSASPEGRSRVLREAQAAARLRHPAIVTLHEVGQDGDTTYLVYDFIPGPTLAQLLRTTKPAPEQAARWIACLAEALDYAHRQKIVHRDVKPANVMMDADNQPLLADFGMARPFDAATLTREGDVLGTPAYMPPEQAGGRVKQIDGRSDVYSLGVMLYELLTGKLPFEGEVVDVLYRVVHDEPPPPRQVRSGLPLDLETICLKAMAKEPGRRYQTAGELADDLRRYLGHQTIRARRRGPLGRLALWCRRHPALTATIVVATLVTAVVTAVSFWQVVQERDRARELAASLALDRGLSLCEEGEGGHGLLWLARSLQLAPVADDDLQFAVRANLSAWRKELSRPVAFPCRRPKPVKAVAFGPDGRTLLVGGDDGEAHLVDAVTGAPAGLTVRHAYPIVPPRSVPVTAGSWRPAAPTGWSNFGTGRPTAS